MNLLYKPGSVLGTRHMKMNKINLILNVDISDKLGSHLISLSLYSSVANSIVEINGILFIFKDHDEYILSIQILIKAFSLHTNEGKKNNFYT